MPSQTSQGILLTADFLIILTGIFGNTLVIITVAASRHLRTPVFVLIAELAITDLVYLTSCLAYAANILTLPDDADMIIVKTDGLLLVEYIRHTSWFSSSVHVAMLSILHTVILTELFTSRFQITVLRVMLTSVGVWFAAGVISAITLVLLFPGSGTADKYDLHAAICLVIYYFLPSFLATSMPLLHLQRIHETIRSTDDVHTRHITVVVIMVVVLLVLFPLPFVISKALFYVALNRANDFDMVSIRISLTGGEVLMHVNGCLRPVIYIVTCAVLRHSVYDVFCNRCQDSAHVEPDVDLDTEIPPDWMVDTLSHHEQECSLPYEGSCEEETST